MSIIQQVIELGIFIVFLDLNLIPKTMTKQIIIYFILFKVNGIIEQSNIQPNR